MKKILLAILTLIMFLSSPCFAIFSSHYVNTNYFFENKNTGEIKRIYDDIDFIGTLEEETILEVLRGTNIGNENIFQDWKVIEIEFCFDHNCHAFVEGINRRMRFQDYIDAGINLKGSDIEKEQIKHFSIKDLTLQEQINIYYKKAAKIYLGELIHFLVFNLMVFYGLGLLLYLKIKKNFLKYIYLNSFILFIISDIILYKLGWGYSQMERQFFGIIVYIYLIILSKIILFGLSCIAIIKYKSPNKQFPYFETIIGTISIIIGLYILKNPETTNTFFDSRSYSSKAHYPIIYGLLIILVGFIIYKKSNEPEKINDDMLAENKEQSQNDII